MSFSQAEGQLREWLNRRKVNKSVGLIPRLEGELAETGAVLSRLEEANRTLSRLEGEKAELEGRKTVLEAERRTHRRLDALELDRRYTQARQDLEAARRQADALEREQARYGALPEREELKRAQGELQYLKVLEEEIRQGEGALREAEEAYEQARREALDDRFNGMSGEEAVSRAAADGALWREALERARREKRRFPLLLSGPGAAGPVRSPGRRTGRQLPALAPGRRGLLRGAGPGRSPGPAPGGAGLRPGGPGAGPV